MNCLSAAEQMNRTGAADSARPLPARTETPKTRADSSQERRRKTLHPHLSDHRPCGERSSITRSGIHSPVHRQAIETVLRGANHRRICGKRRASGSSRGGARPDCQPPSERLVAKLEVEERPDRRLAIRELDGRRAAGRPAASSTPGCGRSRCRCSGARWRDRLEAVLHVPDRHPPCPGTGCAVPSKPLCSAASRRPRSPWSIEPCLCLARRAPRSRCRDTRCGRPCRRCAACGGSRGTPCRGLRTSASRRCAARSSRSRSRPGRPRAACPSTRRGALRTRAAAPFCGCQNVDEFGSVQIATSRIDG